MLVMIVRWQGMSGHQWWRIGGPMISHSVGAGMLVSEEEQPDI
jgi:hypothetical protein